MSSCTPGSLITILPPSGTDECACNCTANDITWEGSDLTCSAISTGDSLTTVILNINDAICDLQTETNPVDVSYCAPNASPPIAPTGTIVDHVEFIASELIPRSGNDCDCPITDDLYFSDTKGIRQCPVESDSGYFTFSGDYALLNADKQVRVSSDLKLDNGFGAGYVEISSSTDLALVNLDQLNYSYGIDSNAASVTLSLTQIAAASLDGKNRRFCIRRLDCNTNFTATIQAYSGETIEGAGSISLPVGHAYIIQADDATNDWVIVAEYYGCTLAAQENGDIYVTYNLGVGDSTPDAKIDVTTTDTTQKVAIFENTGAASADLIQVKRNGSVVDVIDEAGRLGVGNSNPAAELHVTGEGATGATKALLVENSSGDDYLYVFNDGETVIRTGTDQKFSFDGGNLAVTDDSGVIRNWTLTSNIVTLSYTRINTANVNLNPNATTTNRFLDLTAVTGTASAGTNDLVIMDVQPTYNLTGTATGDTYLMKYAPTFTSTSGNNYGIVISTAGTKSGFGQSAPTSTLHTGGSFATNIRSVAGNTIVAATDHTLLVDSSGGNCTVTLPAANTCTGRIYIIKKTTGDANTITISPNADGAAKTITNQYAFYAVQSDGSNYYVIGNN